MAVLDPQVIDPHRPILESEAKAALSDGLFEDDPSLILVLADTLKAEAYAGTKSWVN
jgi:hypothetical protein